MSTPSTRIVTSVVGGSPVAGVHTQPSTNPAELSEVVGEVSFADAPVFVGAAEAARKAQDAWAAVPAPVRGRAIAHIGRLVEDNAEALARLVTAEIGKPYAEALGEVREVIDTCDASSVRAGGSTARPCQARCLTSSCSPSASRSGWRR